MHFIHFNEGTRTGFPICSFYSVSFCFVLFLFCLVLLLLLLFSYVSGLGLCGYERHNNVMGISRSEAPGRPLQIDGGIVDGYHGNAKYGTDPVPTTLSLTIVNYNEQR